MKYMTRAAGVGRRDVLKGATAAGAVALSPAACTSDDDGGETPAPDPGPFRHGVASGDPLPEGVILWTRVTRDGASDLEVAWEMATSPDFAEIAASGVAVASAASDFTVKVDAGGLSPATTYYYRFQLDGDVSPIGRTRTAPTGPTSRLRFAVTSCSSYAHGYFHVYRHIADRADLDAVLHLGDYIYEYASNSYGDVRPYDPPHEILTLEDYRRRYAHYRLDPDLQELHRQHPVIAVWDDHETANNSWSGGAENHTEGAEGAWTDRLAAAAKAYAEWLPIRVEPGGPIYRSLSYGDLVQLLMLDTRIWGRDEQASGEDDPSLLDQARTLLGADQEAWLASELTASTARWKVLGQQVMMGQLPQFLNTDQWDGYPAARQRFFDLLVAQDMEGVLILTGDIHSSWAIDLAQDPSDPASYDPATGQGSLAVELVTPGVTSPGFPPELAAVAEGLLADNVHIQYADLTRRGYIVLDVTEAALQGDYYHVEQVTEPDLAPQTFSTGLRVPAGQRHLDMVTTPIEPKGDAPPLAP